MAQAATDLTFDRAEARIRWALAAVPSLLDERRVGEEEMWILAHGFCNAFYAVREILRSAKKTTPERQAFEEWLTVDEGNDEMEFLLTEFRNKLTHHDGRSPAPTISWEMDPINDTHYPVQSYPYIKLVPRNGGPTRSFTFREWVVYCFEWLRDQLVLLRRRHQRILRAQPSVP